MQQIAVDNLIFVQIYHCRVYSATKTLGELANLLQGIFNFIQQGFIPCFIFNFFERVPGSFILTGLCKAFAQE